MKKRPNRVKQFCKYGHNTFITGRDKSNTCIICRIAYDKKRSKKRYLSVREDKRKIKMQFCLRGHDTFICGRGKNGRCIECTRNYIRKYRIEHKSEINKKSLKRKEIDINYNLACHLRDRLNKAIKKDWKVGSAVKDLGCSIDFLKKYIESKFYGNMSWNNWGKVWELDHIKELHTFNLTDRKQFLEACHYTNLQPLTIEEHRKKSAKEKGKNNGK